MTPFHYLLIFKNTLRLWSSQGLLIKLSKWCEMARWHTKLSLLCIWLSVQVSLLVLSAAVCHFWSQVLVFLLFLYVNDYLSGLLHPQVTQLQLVGDVQQIKIREICFCYHITLLCLNATSVLHYKLWLSCS